MRNRKLSAGFLLMTFYLQFAGNLYAAVYTTTINVGNANTTCLNSSNKIFVNNNTPTSKIISVAKNKAIDNNAIIKPESEESVNGGPTQPEMLTFQSVNSDNMVNLFTGDFSYNIPLLDLGGYPINIFYSGGITMDQEPSWVGLGWNLNPGTITRNMRGLPDDFDGTDIITKTQKLKKDNTFGLNFSKEREVIGLPNHLHLDSWNVGVYFNNKTGMGLEVGTNFSEKLNLWKNKTDDKNFDSAYMISRQNLTLDSKSGLSISPNFSVQLAKSQKSFLKGASVGCSFNSRTGITGLQVSGEYYINYKTTQNSLYGYKNSCSFPITFAEPAVLPSIRNTITNSNTAFTYKFGLKDGKIKSKVWSLKGYNTSSFIALDDQEVKKRAYGFLYLDKAGADDGALLDFNRINDNPYTKASPTIAAPQYTYDVFSINGEGTGGSFRAYRNNIGFTNDPYNRTKNSSEGLGFELNPPKGTAGWVEAGVNVDLQFSTTTVHKWDKKKNLAEDQLSFNGRNKEVEGVYFKNPTEKAVIPTDYYNAIGGDKLMRLQLTNPATFFTLNQPSAIPSFETFDNEKNYLGNQYFDKKGTTKIRDKRAQVISFLSASEAEKVGFNNIIKSYYPNDFDYTTCERYRQINRVTENGVSIKDNYRRRNHISEIDVLEQDGKRYIYGVPVYNTVHKEVTLGIARNQTTAANTEASDQIAKYDLATANQTFPYVPLVPQNTKNGTQKDEDGVLNIEEIPPYAHSFLLSALLSTDYVDVTNDGITDDDLGTAVKFNYSRLGYNTTTNTWDNLKWRTPFVPNSSDNTAIHLEGLKTNADDDKASYSYGEREQWYLHSVESKNMVAVFRTSTRRDNTIPADENGGVITSNVLKQLDRIDLYAKTELAKKGINNAKPIKSVFFTYGYTLCNKTPTNSNNNYTEGKLTLLSIAFSYNGNNKTLKNLYKFAYDINPDYKRNEMDRWGVYKPLASNPSSLLNSNFPYTPQPGLNAKAAITKNDLDNYAGAWNLTKILLPSGAQVNVKYEADDYAYVQNKRACQMLKIKGMGSSPSGLIDKGALGENYTTFGNNKSYDFDYLYIDLPANITITGSGTPSEIIQQKHDKIKKLFFEGMNQLVMKLAVKMPRDFKNETEEYETVTVFANLNDQPLDPAFGMVDNTTMWIRVSKNKDHSSPMMATSVQFLKDNLSSKAFPGQNVDPNATGILQFARSIVGMLNSISTVISNFEHTARARYMCVQFDPNRSFVRLANPYFAKIGGGYRVKEIRIKDNWDKMTKVGGSSSGTKSEYGQQYDYTTDLEVNGTTQSISSGVATYEPFIGAEENPYKASLSYQQDAPLAPTQYGYTETPILDAMYPSPMVGYSKVRVKSINNSNTVINTTTGAKVKNAVGVQETQFYTTKDFPSYCDFTNFDQSSRIKHKPNPILKFLNIYWEEAITLSQGFRVVLNDMNGKIKSQASYPESEPTKPINYTEYIYRAEKTGEDAYKLDNNILVANKQGKIETKEIGKDIELMVDFRQHVSTNCGLNVEFNFYLEKIPPPIVALPLPFSFNPPSFSKNTYRDVSVLKVVNQFGILESIKQIDKGSEVSTKNILYDAETGEVLLNQTQNEFNKPIYNFSYPAHWAYQGMGAAYKNIDVTFDKVIFKNGLIQNPINEIDQSFFESGDELYVNDDLNSFGPKNTTGCWGLRGTNPKYLPKNTEYRIWAVDIAKANNNTPAPALRQLIFIDKDGTPYNSLGTNIRIIRSGKRNLLNATVGTATSLENPIAFTNVAKTEGYIEITDNKKLLNAAAVEYREKWRAEDAFYAEVHREWRKLYAPLSSGGPGFPAIATTYVREKRHCSGLYCGKYVFGDVGKYNDANSIKYFGASSWDDGNNSADFNSQSWALFDFSSLKNKKVVSASLSLYAHIGQAFGSIINHNLADKGLHNKNTPHFLNSNIQTFTISRLSISDPWLNITSSKWVNDIHDNNHWAENSKLLATSVNIPNIVPHNKASFPGTFPGGQYSSIKIENADLAKFQKMIDDYNPVNKENPSIVGIINNNGGSQFCFSSGFPVNNNEGQGPLFNVTYYDPNQGSIEPPSNPANYIEYWDSTDITYCYSVFDRTFMNPYLHGILGNWRNNISYIFKGNRIEKDPLTSTNISVNGVLEDFHPYWQFTANSYLQADNSNNQWVWNSQISQYNGRGLEIENFDALYRFNCGVYGYNNTLPTAVVNNARYKEAAFDGFEDYSYSERGCNIACKQTREDAKRHFRVFDDYNRTNGSVSSNESHTGLTSLLVAQSQTFDIALTTKEDITPYNSDFFAPYLNIPMTDGTYNTNGVNAQGTGLTRLTKSPLYGSWRCPFIEYPLVSYDGQNWPAAIPQAGCSGFDWAHFQFKYDGRILFPEDGDYEFGFQTVDNEGWYTITNPNNTSVTVSGHSHFTFTQRMNETLPYNAQYLDNVKKIQNIRAGDFFDISLFLTQVQGGANMKFLWKLPGDREFTEIPLQYFYPQGTTLSTGTVTPQNFKCIKPSQIQATSNFKIDDLGLVPNKKMILSMWVKEEQPDCRQESYIDNSVEIWCSSFIGNHKPKFKASGNIIEGWQRYECAFETPAGTNIPITVKLNASPTANTYFDDIRLMPYNSNMKSFVYDPVSLRLTAELDENNYATFYEYDDDGTLIRVKKETKEGIKTIKETRSAMQKTIQDID